MRAVGGVESIGAASFLPASGRFNGWGTRLANDIDSPVDMPNIQSDQRIIDGDYFETLGIELRRGRTFDDRDSPEAPRRVLVSESLVQRLFTDEDPVGRYIRIAGLYPQIIGVVDDVPVSARGEVVPKIYHRHAQFAENRNWRLHQVVRTNAQLADPVPALRATLHEIDPELVLHLPRPMNDVIGRGVAAERFAMVLLGAFAFLAVLLASLGLYGILAHSVVRKRREIGVRMALGAQSGQVVWLVLR